MIEDEYREAAVEALDILSYTDKEDIRKIPQSFINFLTDIASKDYSAKFNHGLPIKGLNLKKQTRELLGFIYITWLCSNDEKENYKENIQIGKIRNEELNEIRNIEDIFEDRNNASETKIKQSEDLKETSLSVYKEDNWIKKLINKIFRFFK